MMKRQIFTSLFAALTLGGMNAQQAPAVPRLVVNLTIDQLRLDYLEAFSALYGEQGFKRLMKEGYLFERGEYGFVDVDRASASAAISTGSVPYTNGIVGVDWLDRGTLRIINCVDDANFMGYSTTEYTSPVRLVTSTVSDELAIATQGACETYSIAPTREMAVLLAGHASGGAFWLTDDTGLWAGTTYYDQNPRWVSMCNESQGLASRIGQLVWEPYLMENCYQYVSPEVQKAGFSYKFTDENKFRKLKTSPLINEEVNSMVHACLYGTNIGRDDIPDLLNVGYYVGNLSHATLNEKPMELQDAYIRLDKTLGELVEMIDKRVGLYNALFVITSTGYSDSESVELEKYKIPTGNFSITRCGALLNLYLAAIYGEGKYVEATNVQEIYLSHKLIESKQLNFNEVLGKAAEFLVQFSGVKDVYSSQRLQLGAWTPKLNKLKNHYNVNCSGDLWLEILPGWTMDNEHTLQKLIVRDNYVSAPILFFGWDIRNGRDYSPVQMECVAPTISHFMRIRAPNAATSAPLGNLRKTVH